MAVSKEVAVSDTWDVGLVLSMSKPYVTYLIRHCGYKIIGPTRPVPQSCGRKGEGGFRMIRRRLVNQVRDEISACLTCQTVDAGMQGKGVIHLLFAQVSWLQFQKVGNHSLLLVHSYPKADPRAGFGPDCHIKLWHRTWFPLKSR